MVALKHERQIFLWNVEAHVIPADAPTSSSVPEIFEIIMAAFSNNKAQIYIDESGKIHTSSKDVDTENRKNTVYVADLVISNDKKSINLLINRGDPLAADPAFLNLSDKSVRPISPNKSETQGWSAHLLLRSHGASWRACFERMPNVSTSLAERLFDIIIDQYVDAHKGDFQYAKTLKKGKKRVTVDRLWKPRLAIKRVPAANIKEDIKRGELSRIRLIDTNSVYSGPDAPDIIRSSNYKMEIFPKKVDQTLMFQFLEKLMGWAKTEGFDEIQFVVDGLPGNRQAQPRILLDKEDAMDTLYVRSERLTGFGKLLERCYASLEDSIVEKMENVLMDDPKWS